MKAFRVSTLATLNPGKARDLRVASSIKGLTNYFPEKLRLGASVSAALSPYYSVRSGSLSAVGLNLAKCENSNLE